MKRNIRNIYLTAILILLLPSCSDNILDKTPLDSYSDPLIWADANLASRYLNAIYDQLPNGNERRGNHYGTGPFTLEHTYLKGGSLTEYDRAQVSPDATGTDRGHVNWPRFTYIQRLNYFIANIDKMPDQESAKILKGEAIFLRAVFYWELCRVYGGVPLFDKPNQLGDDFSEVGRNTFKETVDFIAKDCDDAAQLLNLKRNSIMGRPTKEAALALKSNLLLFAASDLTADGTAQSEYVGYKNPDRNALWTAAKNAAKAVMDLGECELSDFGAPDQEAVAKKYFDFFKAYTPANKEVIWARMYRLDVGFAMWTNRWCGPNGLNCWGNNAPYGNMVDDYEMEDGSKFFDHFTFNTQKEYVNISSEFTNKNIYYNREPRFYASILYDSILLQKRTPDMIGIDPLGIYDRRTRIVRQGGVELSKRFGLDTPQGPVTPQKAPYTGYLIKKQMDDQVAGGTDRNQNICIWIRYAEILLNYAEASFELGDIPAATQYVNIIRNRAGLPDFTGDIETALRHERNIELAFENKRWFDERRWKTLKSSFDKDLYGVDITEVTEDGVTTTKWMQSYAAPKKVWHDKLYWFPIPRDEINRAPNLDQNPLYE